MYISILINCLDFKAHLTNVLMQIANQEPIDSIDLIFLADGRW